MWNLGTRARRRSTGETRPMATPGEAGMPMSFAKAEAVYQVSAAKHCRGDTKTQRKRRSRENQLRVCAAIPSEVGQARLQAPQLLVYFDELYAALLRGELGSELGGRRLELRLRGGRTFPTPARRASSFACPRSPIQTNASEQKRTRSSCCGSRVCTSARMGAAASRARSRPSALAANWRTRLVSSRAVPGSGSGSLYRSFSSSTG